MKNNIVITMPLQVTQILEKLESSGYEAYIVGGCVRDSIMCRDAKDWDICTSATPDEVCKVFSDDKVIETGLKHGTVTVVLDDVGCEITTFRVDGNYSDKRRPDSVSFTSSLEQDLSRRDFTINAMAYNSQRGLIDPYGGIEDILDKNIRCVGDAYSRFSEDSLRILRALRFACQLGFTIHTDTASAMIDLRNSLSNVSKERICAELSKMIVCNSFPSKLSIFRQVFFTIIPELKIMDGFDQNNPYHDHDVFDHTIYAVEYADPDLVIKLAALLHDTGKPHCYSQGEDGYTHFRGHGKFSASIATEILNRLRFDNQTTFEVVQLVHFHDATIEPSKKHIKRWLNKLGEVQFRRLLKLRYADISAQSIDVHPDRILKITQIESMLDEVLADNEAFSIKHLAINGNDLKTIGYNEGLEIGAALRKLLDCVVDEELINNKSALLNKAMEWRDTK